MSTIPLADPSVGTAELARIKDVIADGQIADGPEVRRFETNFAKYCDSANAVATSNGTTALHTALHAVGVEPGDLVVTTPFSFVATANAIRHCGATPVFADINPTTYTLDPAAVKQVIEEHGTDVTAMIPVHLYGLPADMTALGNIAEEHDLSVVVDAAQAHGAEYRGRPVGSWGDAGCFSFYPTKNMTTGEGGMIVTDRDDITERARRFINHGRAAGANGYEHVEVGHNFRMTSIAAAIGQAQLERLPDFVQKRRENATTLTDALKDTPGITTTIEPPDRTHA
jgi:dTDP-4-amino-4,6-dideoxygalactose transaminase